MKAFTYKSIEKLGSENIHLGKFGRLNFSSFHLHFKRVITFSSHYVWQNLKICDTTFKVLMWKQMETWVLCNIWDSHLTVATKWNKTFSQYYKEQQSFCWLPDQILYLSFAFPFQIFQISKKNIVKRMKEYEVGFLEK